MFDGATRPAVRCLGAYRVEGSFCGIGGGNGGTSGTEAIVDAVDCLNRSSVEIEIREVMSIVLVGLTGTSDFAGRRNCNGGGGCNDEKDRGGRVLVSES